MGVSDRCPYADQVGYPEKFTLLETLSPLVCPGARKGGPPATRDSFNTHDRLQLILGFDLDERTHPGMDAALEAVIAHAEPPHLRPGTRRQKRSGGALRSGGQAFVERRNDSAAKGRNLCEGMASATPVPHPHGLVGFDREIRGLVPPRRMPNGGQRQR